MFKILSNIHVQYPELLQSYQKDIDVSQGLKCASGLFYYLDFCHRHGSNSCFPRVIRPQLTNNMVLFSANGTNSTILRRGVNVNTIITLSEPVSMFSTRFSKLHVSTAFFLQKTFFALKSQSRM